MLRVLAAAALAFAGVAHAACVPPGTWVLPERKSAAVPADQVFELLARKDVVLLGESHDSAEHHRWQLQVISALHARRPQLALGFEMFPRRAQAVLDRWVNGELTEAQFLEQSDWRNVWGMDPQLYLPLFHFARMNRVPMIALNVDKDGKGESITQPAAPAPKYLDSLFEAFGEHQRDAKADRTSDAFRRFVDRQLLWDRSMAQGLARAAAARGGTLAIGVMGRHHVEHGYGVPHQLADLGVRAVASLVPWDADAKCDALVAGVADAVFGVAPPAAAEARRPRLGVRLESADGGVRLASVDKGSVADAAGLRAGDLVLEIAGKSAKQPGDIAETVQRQAPGTWLPLRVRRDGAALDVVAKFPPLAD